MRPLTSGVEPRGALPGVFGGKLWVKLLGGTRGEKVGSPGRGYRVEDRKIFREVEAAPEKLVLLEWSGSGRDTVDANEEDGLLGLSPGIRFGVATAVLAGCGVMSDAEILWESLLDGPCGRPMILRAAICDSEARFAGLCGADALLNSGCVRAALLEASDFASLSSAGAGELRKSPVKPKRLRFFDGRSIMVLVGERRLDDEARG